MYNISGNVVIVVDVTELVVHYVKINILVGVPILVG